MDVLKLRSLLPLLWTLLIAPTALAQTNLVVNGDFSATNYHGWENIWSRDPNAATAEYDNTTGHSGSVSMKIVSTDPKDWSFAQIATIPVHPGEVYELSAWVKCDNDQSASISVTTRDGAGNVLDWQAGDVDTSGTHDWEKLTSRVVIPAVCTTIQYRLTGDGTGTVWLDDASLVKVGDIEALRSRLAGKRYRIQNADVSVEFIPESTSFQLTDRRTGQTWTQTGVSDELVATDARTVGNTEMDVVLTDEALDVSVTAKTILLPGQPEVTMAIESNGAMSQNLLFPLPMSEKSGNSLVMPTNEGMLFPVDNSAVPQERLQLYCGHGGLSMPWWGLLHQDGSGIVTLVRTPDDAEVDTDRATDGLMYPQLEWAPSRGGFSYTRKITYILFNKGGYVAQAKWYRAYTGAMGNLVTLAQKSKVNPNVDKLLGAADVWTWAWSNDEADICRQMKAAGMDHVLWSNYGRADQIAAINAMGFLTGKYDQYQDAYPAGSPPIMFPTKWPDDLVLDRNGNMLNGWLASWTNSDGTKVSVQAGVCSSKIALGIAQQAIPNDLASVPLTARFLDTDTASPWREDYNPLHPMSRSDDKKWRLALLAYVSQTEKLVTGSETGINSAVPYLDYFEGMMSISEFRNDDSGRNMQDIIPPSSDILKFQVGPEYRIPLFELVYHDCVVNYWYWGDYNNKEPAVWPQRDLFNILYATPPVYMFDRQSWTANKAHFVQSYRDIGPIARALGYQQMLSHEFVTPDHTVQCTHWSNGTSIYINLGTAPFALSSGKSVPAMGWLVTGNRSISGSGTTQFQGA